MTLQRPNITKELIIKEYKENKLLKSEICEKYNITKWTFYDRLKRYNIQPNTKEEIQKRKNMIPSEFKRRDKISKAHKGDRWSKEKNRMWKGGRHPATYRKYAFEVHGKKCFTCGTEERTEVHHWDWDPTYENNDPKDVAIFCRKHHKQIHSLMIKIAINYLKELNLYEEVVKRTKNILQQNRGWRPKDGPKTVEEILILGRK